MLAQRSAITPNVRSFGSVHAEAMAESFAVLDAMDGPTAEELTGPEFCACGALKEIDATVCEECR